MFAVSKKIITFAAATLTLMLMSSKLNNKTISFSKMKKIVMALAIAGLGSVAMAQDVKTTSENKHEVLTNRFFDNWFISAGAGAEMLIGNGDTYYGIGDRISPTFNVALGKWFTPGLGLRLQYSGYEAKGARKGFGNYAKGQPDAAGYYEQKFHYMNLHGDVMFNLNALLGGYNPKRVYEIVPYLGAGFTHSYSGDKTQGLAVNAGIINKFRVAPVLDINLELSGMMAQNKFDGELGGKKDFDGTVAASVGLTYYFKKRGFNKVKPCPPQLISETELSGMRQKMNALAGENQDLKDQLAVAPKEVVVIEEKESVKKVPDIAPHAIFFNLGSAVVSPQELINLGFMADMVKEYPNLKLKLTGYADAATGTAEMNKAVSLKRAEAVADALNKTYGISRSRITTDAAGGVEKFEKDYLNRMVLIEVVK